LEKERAAEPTITLMKRPTNIGGLELNEQAAKNILKELEAEGQDFISPFAGETAPEVEEIMKKGSECCTHGNSMVYGGLFVLHPQRSKVARNVSPDRSNDDVG